MDLMGVVARVNGISNDWLVENMNKVVDLLLSGSVDVRPLAEVGYFRLFFVHWITIYLGTILLYFFVAGMDYLLFFVIFKQRYIPDYVPKYKEMRREILFSLKSLILMAGMVAPTEVLVSKGYSKIYHNVGEHGLLYFFLSPLLFFLFTDFVIYWVHRGLHHRSVYKYIHKPHHSFIHTTPFAAFAFHPLDGYAQGVAYHIFIYIFPFHSFMHLASLFMVGIWTINIHDRVDLNVPFINGAGHHRIHHTTFKSNYGQYFVFSDWMFGTMRDPEKWKDVVENEDDVYGDPKKFK